MKQSVLKYSEMVSALPSPWLSEAHTRNFMDSRSNKRGGTVTKISPWNGQQAINYKIITCQNGSKSSKWIQFFKPVKPNNTIVCLLLLTMTNLNYMQEMLLFVCSKMADYKF